MEINTTPKAGELFAGYGGLALAVSSVFGAETGWLCEVDKYASQVLTCRFPDVPNLGDVTTIDWGSVDPVDIIAGGSPDRTFGLRCVTQCPLSNQVSWCGKT